MVCERDSSYTVTSPTFSTLASHQVALRLTPSPLTCPATRLRLPSMRWWVGRSRSVVVLGFLVILAAPLATDAQPPPKIPRIGYLGPTSSSAGARLLESFRQGLRELGYVEGQNIFVDYRWAEGRPDRFPALAATAR